MDNYCTIAEMAKKWNLSDRTVRNYCANGHITGVISKGNIWYIPADTPCPSRDKTNKQVSVLLRKLQDEKKSSYAGGIYHETQVELTYHSNRIEGCQLTLEQTRYISETNTMELLGEAVNIDDIIETVNHFRCINLIIDNAEKPLSEQLIKKIHLKLKSGTSDESKDWFVVGDYKKLPNEVGGRATVAPANVHFAIKKLLNAYNEKASPITFDDILDFHVQFERIHPFQDGNGRVGRLIMFKECLRNNIVPFIIEDDIKMYYYRGLSEWGHINGYLRDTCLTAQDRYKKYLDYFQIPYTDNK